MEICKNEIEKRKLMNAELKAHIVFGRLRKRENYINQNVYFY